MSFALGRIWRTDGSAEFRTEEGCVMLSRVDGPCVIKQKMEKMDRATVTVEMKALGMPPTLLHTSMAAKLQSILESCIVGALHPRTLISITVQPILVESDLGYTAFATAFNAMVGALIDGSIPMFGIPVAITLCLSNYSALFIVLHASTEQPEVIFQEGHGSATIEEIEKLTKGGIERSKVIFQSLQEAILASYNVKTEPK